MARFLVSQYHGSNIVMHTKIQQVMVGRSLHLAVHCCARHAEKSTCADDYKTE